MKFLFKNLQKGFTLAELVVVMSVFLLVMGSATSIFISVISNQKRILTQQEVLSQISYTMEYMSKSLRMAKTDIEGNCLGDPEGTDTNVYNYKFTRLENGKYLGIKFVNQSDDDACTEYFLDKLDPNNISLKEIKNGKEAVSFTSSKLKIIQAEFRINGINNGVYQGSFLGDGIQPRVTIFLDAFMQIGANQIEKKIQTTISQRNLNSQ